MDIQHKLMKPFLTMDSKLLLIILIIFILSFSACKRADDAWNKVVISNKTNELLILNISKKHISNVGEYFLIEPKNSIELANAIYTSDFGIIEDNWGMKGDTIEIFNHDTTVILAKWGAPLRDLPDSIHSFYNKNSWVIEQGGRKNKYTIITFIIEEDDLNKNE